MRVVYRGTYRGTTGRVRSGLSFGVSGCLHGCVLAWVILGGAVPPPERAESIYDREIRPYEKRIVWYSLREKLPEIAPSGTRGDARPARARMKAPQTMVAGATDDARPAPLIWAPEPEAAAPKEMPLPNVVAVTPRVVRPFVAPPVKAPAGTPAVLLPDAPRVAGDVKQPSGPQGGTPVAADWDGGSERTAPRLRACQCPHAKTSDAATAGRSAARDGGGAERAAVSRRWA
jgi:hypothetical protein